MYPSVTVQTRSTARSVGRPYTCDTGLAKAYAPTKRKAAANACARYAEGIRAYSGAKRQQAYTKGAA